MIAARDGVSQHYGAGETVSTDAAWLARAEQLLSERDVQTRRAYHLTWPSLFAQSNAMCDGWIEERLLSIDMETSAVVAAADHYGASAVSMLTVWDALPHGRTFLDPLAPRDLERLRRSNRQVFEVALALAGQAESLRRG